ncbi:hypothetical protein MA16_Dca002755 [Dendrobium catenatum]|uniref:Uncharacterized protein n=1 Tax=Dendrobium catenatum TaxID=906689 RepID=A0A2I0X8K2_9ASPA|nr:hypothetical protein MA16_Dca002755 [Dendrobium catenatum]
MSLRMKTGTCMLLLLLLAMVVCSLATRRITMADSTSQGGHKQKLVKTGTIQDEGFNKNTHSFPATSVDNHHIIPRTDFNSNSPPDADDQGTEGGEIND